MNVSEIFPVSVPVRTVSVMYFLLDLRCDLFMFKIHIQYNNVERRNSTARLSVDA